MDSMTDTKRAYSDIWGDGSSNLEEAELALQRRAAKIFGSSDDVGSSHFQSAVDGTYVQPSTSYSDDDTASEESYDDVVYDDDVRSQNENEDEDVLHNIYCYSDEESIDNSVNGVSNLSKDTTVEYGDDCDIFTAECEPDGKQDEECPPIKKGTFKPLSRIKSCTSCCDRTRDSIGKSSDDVIAAKAMSLNFEVFGVRIMLCCAFL